MIRMQMAVDNVRNTKQQHIHVILLVQCINVLYKILQIVPLWVGLTLEPLRHYFNETGCLEFGAVEVL